MKGEILSIGTELLMGELTDTNSSYIASQVPALGIAIQRMSQVGDDLKELTEAFAQAMQRSEIVFSTGGLGPTQDDLTREAISAALGEEMKVDPVLLEDLKGWFRYRNHPFRSSSSTGSTFISSPRAAEMASRVRSSWVGPRPPVEKTISERCMA